MFQASLPTRFWGECVSTAIHLINITPTPILGNNSPHEVLFGKPPNYSNLRVFGSLCYAHTRTKDKFEPRSRKCAFIGYPHGKKGWRLYDMKNRKMFVSRDVRFCETIFPFATKNEDLRRQGKEIPLFMDGVRSIIPRRWIEESQPDSRRLIHLSGTSDECSNWAEQPSLIWQQQSSPEIREKPKHGHGSSSAQQALEVDPGEKETEARKKRRVRGLGRFLIRAEQVKTWAEFWKKREHF
ncbi:hypothetical protein CRG98_022497 [Punica granatum]|uniref:Retroviral polymerase SH3-like domain-containing protein n=1 Tax=Punica granatum TaxID=22663 RepID=A0A2I0JME5_PUNGR|nr:hypothetical protein CRG98_022497 [Punica granatum]